MAGIPNQMLSERGFVLKHVATPCFFAVELLVAFAAFGILQAVLAKVTGRVVARLGTNDELLVFKHQLEWLKR